MHAISVHCTQWFRREAMADSGINDQLIKLHSTHSWIRCVLSFSVSYFVVCYFRREHLIPPNY